MISKTKKLLAEGVLTHQRKLSEWYLEKAKLTTPPFYVSIDLRDSGHKIVPVDNNLYPAGFNNICPEDQRTAPNILRAQIDAFFSKRETPRRILILPESHTQNLYYVENLYYLSQIVENAGFETRVGWYGPVPEGMPVPLRLTTATGKEILAHPIRIDGGEVSVEGFVPDIILLNNDFSSGYPAPLDSVRQPILPPHTMGWHSRKKSDHFKRYNSLAEEFARIVDVDPWLIRIDTEAVDDVDFDEDQGVERVVEAVERVLERTRMAYAEHKINRTPFVFVKNNSGTYGMGIMMVKSGEELRQMNRRTKHKMSVGKNKMPITSVAVQEGVPTATLVDRLAAEPVIYLFGTELIGGFLRTNPERGDDENLNAPGMVFRKLCMSDLRELEVEEQSGNPEDIPMDLKNKPILELAYGTVARLSALATGMEFADHPAHGPKS